MKTKVIYHCVLIGLLNLIFLTSARGCYNLASPVQDIKFNNFILYLSGT